MTLYVAPGACSLACHVVVRELDLPIDVVCVSLTDPSAPHRGLHPSGRVPLLVTSDGFVLTENTAILPFLADRVPGTPLFASPGSTERAHIQSWLGYLATEIHAGCFRAINRPQRYHHDPTQQPVVKMHGMRLLAQAVKPMADRLQHSPWLMGDRFTLADAYLGVFCGWMVALGDRFDGDEVLFNYLRRYRARASVAAAMAAEAVASRRIADD